MKIDTIDDVVNYFIKWVSTSEAMLGKTTKIQYSHYEIECYVEQSNSRNYLDSRIVVQDLNNKKCREVFYMTNMDNLAERLEKLTK